METHQSLRRCPLRYQLHSKSLLGFGALLVLTATACSDDFPSTSENSDYLVTLDIAEEHAGVNEELTLICTVSHDGQPVSELDVELRYTHMGDAGGGDVHASAKDLGADPCMGEQTGHQEGMGGSGGESGHQEGMGGAGGEMPHQKDATGHGGAGGGAADCEPGNHIAMMHGEEPGTYVGTHTFEEAGMYEIEIEFEGHDGPELHHINLEIEGAGAH